jgi:aldehyde dehydrogenase (NAD+)
MGYDQELSFVYLGSTKIVFGVGTSRDVGMEMAGLGCSRALVVADPGVIKAGLVDGVVKALGNRCVGLWSEVPQDTGVGIVNRAAAFAREKGADCVVSVGGGSVIDTGKGICILLTEGGSLENFEGIQLLTRPQTPHIVIPTTAGTGSEVTCMAVILDERKGQKILIVEYFNTPRIAILDPKMTEKLPPLLTVSTGMDAMTHAVEALQSTQREPIADGLAMQAIRLLHRHLPVCAQNGSDLAARGQVQLAATMAGWAFGNAMVGLVHAMAHSLGAIARVPHGIANGILLPHVMAFNLNDAAEGYAMAAEAMGVREKGMDDPAAAQAAVVEMDSFLRKIGHPLRLSETGAKDEDLVKAAALSLSDGAIVNNPRMVLDEQEVLAVYRAAF